MKTVSGFIGQKAAVSFDPACFSMVPRSCPFLASTPNSPCKAPACGSAGRKSLPECRSHIKLYCASAGGQTDRACWRLLPKSCRFRKTMIDASGNVVRNPASPCYMSACAAGTPGLGKVVATKSSTLALTTNTTAADPAGRSMVEATTDKQASGFKPSRGRVTKHTAGCRAAVVAYCKSPAAQPTKADAFPDPACSSLLPKNCPFNRLTAPDKTKVLEAKAAAAKTAGTALAADVAAQAALKTAQEGAKAAADKATADLTASGEAKAAADTSGVEDPAAKKAADDAKVAADGATAAVTIPACDDTSLDLTTCTGTTGCAWTNGKCGTDDPKAKLLKDAADLAKLVMVKNATLVKAAADAKIASDASANNQIAKNATLPALKKAAADSKLATDAAAKAAKAAAVLADAGGTAHIDPTNPDPCFSVACGVGGPRSNRCRAAVVTWCNSPAGKVDHACWGILHSFKTFNDKNGKFSRCPFHAGIEGAVPTSPCRALACKGLSGSKSLKCRGTVALYCRSKTGQSDSACRRIQVAGSKMEHKTNYMAAGKAQSIADAAAAVITTASGKTTADADLVAANAVLVAATKADTDAKSIDTIKAAAAKAATDAAIATTNATTATTNAATAKKALDDLATDASAADTKAATDANVEAKKAEADAKKVETDAKKAETDAKATLATAADPKVTGEALAAATKSAADAAKAAGEAGVAADAAVKAKADLGSATSVDNDLYYLTCPFDHTQAGNPCSHPSCGFSKKSGACRAAVINYCSVHGKTGKFNGVTVTTDVGCTGPMYRSKHYGAPRFLKPTPSANNFKLNGNSRAGFNHNGFDLEVRTLDAVTGGRYAVYENGNRPTGTKAFGHGAAVTGFLSKFTVPAGDDSQLSMTRVESCLLMPTKTYWVYVEMHHTSRAGASSGSNAKAVEYASMSDAIRVRSPHDLDTLQPTFARVTNHPTTTPAGWRVLDKYVGPIFKVDYALREDAAGSSVDLRFVSTQSDPTTGDTKCETTCKYVDYPYGSAGRVRRLRYDESKGAMFWGAAGGVARRLEGAAVDDYRRDPGWGASLRERSDAHAFHVALPGSYGTCGDHTYTHTSAVTTMSSAKYKVEVSYQDAHIHNRAGVESYEFTVDTTLPVLTKAAGPKRTGTKASTDFMTNEDGWVYWRVVESQSGLKPSPTELATDMKTLKPDGTTGKEAVAGGVQFAIAAELQNVARGGGEVFETTYKLFTVPVDRAGNIGAVTETTLPRVGGPIVDPDAKLPSIPEITKIAVVFTKKTSLVFNVRVVCPTAGTQPNPEQPCENGDQVSEIFWIAREGKDVAEPAVSTLNGAENLKWNQAIVYPAAELFKVTTTGLKPGTSYTFYWSTLDPSKPVNTITRTDGSRAPRYKVVPCAFTNDAGNCVGISATTLKATDKEYTGTETNGILGDATVSLRFAVVLGQGSSLTWVLNRGGPSWTNQGVTDPLGMETKYISGVKAASPNTFVDQNAAGFQLPSSGAGIFVQSFAAPQIPTDRVYQKGLGVDGSDYVNDPKNGGSGVYRKNLVDIALTAAGVTLPGTAAEREAEYTKNSWTTFFVPESANIIIFENNKANEKTDITISSTMEMVGFTACNFVPSQQEAFCATILAAAKVQKAGVSTCTVTAVKDKKADGTFALPANCNAVQQLFTQQVFGGRRLQLGRDGRRLAADSVILIEYDLKLKDARDVIRATIIFEELKSFEKIKTDPVMQGKLVKALIANGMKSEKADGTLVSPSVGVPFAITGADPPKTSHKSTAWEKPSFGFGAKPLKPTTPDAPPVKPTKPALANDLTGVYAGAGIGAALAVLLIASAGIYFWKTKQDKANEKGRDEACSVSEIEPAFGRAHAGSNTGLVRRNGPSEAKFDGGAMPGGNAVAIRDQGADAVFDGGSYPHGVPGGVSEIEMANVDGPAEETFL